VRKGIALIEEQHGLGRGLTNYGDAHFSLYLRRSFAKSMGYSAEMLSRPVVGIARVGQIKRLGSNCLGARPLRLTNPKASRRGPPMRQSRPRRNRASGLCWRNKSRERMDRPGSSP
jgi:hypothetical protein